MWMGKTLQVATPGHYIALVSTVKENADPAADVARPAASPSPSNRFRTRMTTCYDVRVETQNPISYRD